MVGQDPSGPEPSAPEALGPEALGPEASGPADGAEPESDPAALRSRIAELEQQSLRALADLDNVRKRSARELAAARADERTRVTSEWLPVLDTLDLALDHAASDPATIVAGVQAVRQQALTVMERLGFARQDRTGEPFDPTRHEAVATVPDDAATPGTVVRVLRPGYGHDGRQLRPAAVVVARGDE